MAEYFNKKELMELPQVYDSGLRFIEVDYIEKVGTIDIVQCVECKHWEQDDREHIIGVCNGGHLPHGIRINMLYIDYCSYGERKE